VEKRLYSILFTLVCVLLALGESAQSANSSKVSPQLDAYNVKWTTQSQNSSESMPLGGGDMGLNVWVEKGDILFYMSRSGAFDENNQLLKLGRTRLRLEPNIFMDKSCQFSQELKLQEGYIQIKGRTAEQEVTINLWVDVFKPVVNIEVNSTKTIDVTAFYESWRKTDRLLPMNERSACFSYSAYEGEVVTYADKIAYSQNKVVWYHRNRSDKLLFDFCVDQQGLSEVKDQLLNTQHDLTFGGLLQGEGMVPDQQGEGKYVDTPYHFWSIKSEQPARQHTIQAVMHTAHAATVEQWKNELLAVNGQTEWAKTKQWWHQFWNRSYIFINADKNDPSDKGWQVGRNYQLFRYQLACNAYGQYPTKFNGGLFTADPGFVKQGSHANNGTPDYRSWGGGSHTGQNQRLVYWPMLKSGDFDMMAPQFEFYRRSLKNVELRTKVYWGHDGCSFTEHPETFGLPAAATWGFDSGRRKRAEDIEHGTLANQWVRLHYTNQLEFAFMILEYYNYSVKDISEYIPFITSSLTFFFEHYKYRQIQRTGQPYDKKGKLVIYPSTACETFKDIKNPTDIAAALMAVINALQTLPDELIAAETKKHWLHELKRVPDLSYGKMNGKKVLVAGKKLPQRINSDMPELYPVFPYGLFGIGKPNNQIAVNTWESGLLDDRKNHISWHQDAIFCARMGLVEEAKEITMLKLQDSERRFPTFWGPGHDWVPDHNWGGSGMIGLQEMLVQVYDDGLYVLPAWPKEWDVDFMLHAPGNAVIKGQVKNGELVHWGCMPENRRRGVYVAPEYK
jgi:hypothetical protein